MAKTLPDDHTFEEALAQLEAVVHELEDGQIGLEESLSRYELGVGLIRRCQSQLRQAEQRIQLVTGVDENGLPNLQPFHSTSSEALPGDAKPVRKKTSDTDPS